mgnify:CR=1 FL=1
MYNNISRYNEQALWRHSNVAGVALLGNVGMKIPGNGIHMPSLNFLHLGENNVTISTSFDVKHFPQLMHLYLNGNNLEHFPSVNLKDNLQFLGIARCNLRLLPSYLSQFHKLKYLCFRSLFPFETKIYCCLF